MSAGDWNTCTARKWSTGTSRGYISESYRSSCCSFTRSKVNILVNHQHHACIADFGLLRIISDSTSSISSISHVEGGTTQWMSPELHDPDRFGMKDGRPTKESDCYALGMVIYEVLSGHVPFPKCTAPIVIRKVMEGERPGRPQGTRGAWFTDDLWRMLELCWKPQPDDRPGPGAILQCLEEVPRPSRPPSPIPTTNGDTDIDTDDLLGLEETRRKMGELWEESKTQGAKRKAETGDGQNKESKKLKAKT